MDSWAGFRRGASDGVQVRCATAEVVEGKCKACGGDLSLARQFDRAGWLNGRIAEGFRIALVGSGALEESRRCNPANTTASSW